jgi:FKBP-type peptidyl-prolyl cis-trans isomerase FkpA
MKQFIYLSAICMLALSACTGSFKKGDNGAEYKIISSGSGKTVAYGNFMQIHIKQVYGGTKDSVLQDSHDFMSRIQPLDSVNIPMAYYKVLKQMKKGDSAIIRFLTDSIFKDPNNPMPPFMKKGKYMYTHITMVNIFETQQQADSANEAEAVVARPRIYKKQMEQVEAELATKKTQIEADSKMIEAYLAQNNMKAQKGKWGTYVVISTEGTGEKISSNDVATVNYTGRTLDSAKVFDSNTDPSFKHPTPYDVKVGELSGIILGWIDALKEMKKGTKATVYIPSTLGYGANGNGEKIKPNANLVFDMEIVDIMNEQAFTAKQKALQQEMMKKMQEQQQQQSQGQPPVDPAKKGN